MARAATKDSAAKRTPKAAEASKGAAAKSAPIKKATAPLGAPHRHVAARDARDRFTLGLFDALWQRYRERVSHVQAYEEVVRRAGATFVNDHIAFRTIAAQKPATGISTLSRIFSALGYAAAGCYHFPDKYLSSLHFEHPVAGFPKLFVSELELWHFPPQIRRAILRTLASHHDPLADDVLAALRGLNDQTDDARRKLHVRLLRWFHELPWDPPSRAAVEEVNAASQFAAWVLVHGYNVNHFTASINSHGVEALGDIEKTIAALRAAGVPMKAEIEGARGSKLRQSATEAAVVDVPIRQGSKTGRMPWTYAYFELAERGEVTDAGGERRRFEGFLGPQATQLFEMTRVKK